MHSMWVMTCKSPNCYCALILAAPTRTCATYVRVCKFFSLNLGKYQDEFVDAQHVRNDLQISQLLLCEDFGHTRTHMSECAKLFLGTSGNAKMSLCMWGMACKFLVCEDFGQTHTQIAHVFPNSHVCECAKLFLGTSENTKMTSLMHNMWGMACKTGVTEFANCFCTRFGPHPHAHVQMCKIISWNLGKYQDDFVDTQFCKFCNPNC